MALRWLWLKLALAVSFGYAKSVSGSSIGMRYVRVTLSKSVRLSSGSSSWCVIFLTSIPEGLVRCTSSDPIPRHAKPSPSSIDKCTTTLLLFANRESGCIDIDSGAYAQVETLDGPWPFGAEQPKKEIATTNNVVAMTKILEGTTNVGWLIRNFFNQTVKCCGQHIIV